MRRRKFVTLLGGTAAAWPLLAVRDRGAGSDGSGCWTPARPRLAACGSGTHSGSGCAVVFGPRWAEGRADRLRAAAAELINLKVDVIATAGGSAVQAAKRATNTIPIVMATSPSLVSLDLSPASNGRAAMSRGS
jgi:putative ABC transport system substrate-binding protein